MEDSTLFNISDEPVTLTASDDGSIRVPVYNVTHVYEIDENSKSNSENKSKRSSRSCWNCGDTGHSLRQCTLPQNQRNIAKQKSLFANRNEFRRYHIEAKDSKYPHLKPGIISDKLREALGLNEDQLPMHVYRMRSLGYPPGWLLDAKIDSSGIEMFDIDGNRVPNADEEEGEIGSSILSMYDESKIISYPGFNEWPAPGTVDETKVYGAPELSYHHSRGEFIKSLNKETAPVNLVKEVVFPLANDSGECDMETEDINDEVRILPEDGQCSFIPPLPDEPLPPPPSRDAEEEVEITSKVAANQNISMEDSNLVSNETAEEEKVDPLAETLNSSHGRVKFIELGTPILKIHSPFNKLPPPEAFQKDISDVINFENLPDSTGAYEKLKGVLKSVRSKMSSLKDNKLNATI